LDYSCFTEKYFSESDDLFIQISSSSSLLQEGIDNNCKINITNSLLNSDGNYAFNFDLSTCIDTSDANSVKEVGNSVHFLFNAIIGRYISGTSFSIQVESAYPMKCTTSDIFKTESTSNVGSKILPSINGTFELSAHDISLHLTTMEKFDQEAPLIAARDPSFQLNETELQPDNLLIGDKALIYAYPDNFKVFENFWLILENCQACNDGECTMDSLDIIQNACSDNLSLSSHMSMPLSTSAEVNQYINTINSDYSYQLAELTLFQFPNTTEITIACDIALRPRQAIDAYNLSNIYGQCDIPSRASSPRKRRSNEDNREIIKLRKKVRIQT